MPASTNAITADRATAAPESAPRLSVSLVGRLGVRFNGRPIELRTRKAGAVLSYLALSEAKQESRERLVGLLWSRSDEEKARASLRQVVRELRSMLEEAGYDGFVAERLMIGIDVGRIEVDIESVIQLAEGGRVHPLLLDTPQLDGRLLEGMDDLDPSFRVWVLAKRQTIHERLMRNLDEGLTSASVPAHAKKRIAAAIVNLDPTHEYACRYLMRAHAEEGDVAGALRIYKALWDLLDRDYAMEPSSATEELVANIKLGILERAPADRAASAANDEFAVRMVRATTPQPVAPISPSANASARMRLVLLPFAMHGVDEDHSHLVQGFSQHLAACLVRFREWSVVDRPPAAVVLPASGTAPQYCIETTAYQAGAEINIVMVLRDDTMGIYVWSESFRLGLGNWFETQQRIIRRIATSLNVQLSTERLLRLVLYVCVARGRGGAAHGPRLRAERQRSMDAAVQRSLLRFLRLDRTSSAARQPIACPFAGALTPRMGLSLHHSLPVRRLCGRHRGLRPRLQCHSDAARMACGCVVRTGAARVGARGSAAISERHSLVLGWVRRADRRGHHTLAPASAPHAHQGAVVKPASTIARRRVSGRRHCAIVLVTMAARGF